MLRHIVHAAKVVAAVARGRSPKWPGVRAAFLRDHPACAACGGGKALEVHHCLPFHLDPARELDPANLVTLCEADGHDCHHVFGHLYDWKAYNPAVREDAARQLKKVRYRPYDQTEEPRDA